MTVADTKTRPEAVVQTAVEDITWGVNMASQLSGAQTVTAPVAVLTTGRGVVVALADGPAVVGPEVQQRIRAGVLSRAGSVYRLSVRFTPSGTTNVLESTLKIYCP